MVRVSLDVLVGFGSELLHLFVVSLFGNEEFLAHASVQCLQMLWGSGVVWRIGLGWWASFPLAVLAFFGVRGAFLVGWCTCLYWVSQRSLGGRRPYAFARGFSGAAAHAFVGPRLVRVCCVLHWA